MKKILILIFASILFLGGIFIYEQAKFNDGKLHVVICNVGQGDSIFMRTPTGTDIIVDGGPDGSVLSCLSKHMPFWDRDIELMFATHPDADHVAGLVSVLQNYKVLSFNTSKKSTDTAIYKKLRDTITQQKIPTRYIYTGDKFTLGQVQLLTLWPTTDYVDLDTPAAPTNNFGLIQVVSYGDFKTLLTADNIAENLDKVSMSSLKIDVLKVPHHGSKTGLDSQILANLNPSLAVISVGAKNKYGHPTPFVLDLLKQFGIKTLRTDQNGEVEIISDGKSWVVK